MSLLTIVQAAADIIGLPRLSAVVGSIDPNARALLQFANMEGADLASEWDWERLRKVQTFAATAAMIQPGALPPDFDRMVPDTFLQPRQRAARLRPRVVAALERAQRAPRYDRL
jgi:hypothetical protein